MNVKKLEKKLQKMVKADFPYAETFCDIVEYTRTYLCREANTTITVNYGTVKGDKVLNSYVVHLFYTGRKSLSFILGMFYQASIEAETDE